MSRTIQDVFAPDGLLAITADGMAHIVTDNDGTDASSGETMFFAVPLTEGPSRAAALGN